MAYLDRKGYIYIHLPKEDNYFRPTATTRGRIRLHRLVMAKHLGRNLYPWESVHHRNQNKQDNRIENLELLDNSTHGYISNMQILDVAQIKQEKISRLRAKVSKIEKEIRLLETEISLINKNK